MTAVERHGLVDLCGALILGFVFFASINYLSLFGIVQSSSLLNQTWFHIVVGVFIGYGVAQIHA